MQQKAARVDEEAYPSTPEPEFKRGACGCGYALFLDIDEPVPPGGYLVDKEPDNDERFETIATLEDEIDILQDDLQEARTACARDRGAAYTLVDDDLWRLTGEWMDRNACRD